MLLYEGVNINNHGIVCVLVGVKHYNKNNI